MRIVLDSNIFVSALISREGIPGRLLAAVKREGTTLVTSKFQIDELRAVFARERLKPYILPSEADDLLFHIVSVGMVIGHLPQVNVSPDPKDNPILATALAAQADLLVSGDKGDVLALENIEGIPIVTAREALRRLQGQLAK